MNIKVLSERDHILLRPAMYIGSVNKANVMEFIADENGIITNQPVNYVTGLIKIINEIIDNSVDVAIKTNFKHSNKISVKITKDCVEVSDNGTGIPVVKSGDDFMPILAWGRARAGSNFEDDENRTQIGMNGVGSFATNCFSKKFIGKTCDGKNHLEVVFEDNASKYDFKVKKASKGDETGTTVKFYPDLERFGISEIDDVHIEIIKQRLINLGLSYPNIEFKINGKKVSGLSFKKFVSMFGEGGEVIADSDNLKFAIIPNHTDDFLQFSYVNGLKIPNGGTHINLPLGIIVNGIRDKLIKRYKGIKPADIKNKLMVVMYMQGVKNLQFNSQSKEHIDNTNAQMSPYFSEINYDAVVKKILKNDAIIDPITEVYKIKEEFKKRQELNELKKTKKRVTSERYTRTIDNGKYLALTEGDSAKGGLMPILGRKQFGYYVLRGKPLNVFTATHEKFIKNEELTDLLSVISNEITTEDLPDGNFYELTCEETGKTYIVNENDIITINGKRINLKEYIVDESNDVW